MSDSTSIINRLSLLLKERKNSPNSNSYTSQLFTEGVEKIVVFGHSYGGVVVTGLASKLHFNIPIEIHSIASPLRGYSSLQKRFEIQTLDLH